MKTSDTSEKGFEAIIEKHLTAHNGYRKSDGTDYDKGACIDKKLLFEFLKETQPKAFHAIGKSGEGKFIKRLTDQIKEKGTLDVLLNGVKYLELLIQLYYKKSASQLNSSLQKWYNANIFSVARQLRYSKKNNKSLDMAIFINGLPVITIELKNQWTSQNAGHAVRQYRTDRDPREPLFAFGRCVVHFAVDDALALMATHLEGEETLFLPFNKGDNDGAGNPENPDGTKTDYLWKDILTKESLGNIIENYARTVGGEAKRKLIFPRYHQLRAVKKLLAHAKQNGTGQKYLVQHSAGSGKSHSIAWLAHQLVSLHGTGEGDVVFHSIIVVTDRCILDRQIRDIITLFSTSKGVVQPIDQGSRQLKQALEERRKIIITTVQKFPFIVESIGELKAKKFAIIIDEAHSSQSGETAGKMNRVLSENKAPYGGGEGKPIEDTLNEMMEGRKMLENGSYFAFTATPKNKTLETFGTKTDEGKFKAFDTYTMKQAIEEGFILDVLENYTTYKSYYELNKAIADNPDFETRQANKKLRGYVENHPHAIKDKSQIMSDHFHAHISNQINGQAKAMVACKGIETAIRYFWAFKQCLKERKSPYKAIVAFSGTKTVDGTEADEAALNGFPGSEIPKRFNESRYRFLIVAEKFQTGFDQPLLHTMYIDKKLAGVQAVQTLSRLNRARAQKDGTFVIDFANTAQEIQEAFEPYYTATILSGETDPNKLHDLQDDLDKALAYTQGDIDDFARLYFGGAPRGKLDPIIDRCAATCGRLGEDAQIGFYRKAKSFLRTYAFLSKILPFNQPGWEKRYWFLKFLAPKLKPGETEDLAKGILQAISLDSYRSVRTSQEKIALTGQSELDPALADTQGKKAEPDINDLQTIIDLFNQKFGTDDWEDKDKLHGVLAVQFKALARNENIINTVKNSDAQNTKIALEAEVESLVQDLIFKYPFLYKKFTDDRDFKHDYLGFVFKHRQFLKNLRA